VVTGLWGAPPRTLYSTQRLVEAFMADGMSHEEALEWISVNTLGTSVGPGTPLFLDDLER